MQVIQLVIKDADISFKIRFSQSTNTRSSSGGLIVVVTTRDGTVGYGECLPRDYVSGETTTNVIDAIESVVVMLFSQRFNNVDDIITWSSSVAYHLDVEGYHIACARCALELAILDAFGKENNLSVADLLGKPRVTHLYYSGIVGFHNPYEQKQIAALLKAIQFKHIKMKVGNNLLTDVTVIEWLRACLGSSMDLRVDANGAWAFDEAVEKISFLANLGVFTIEQPLARTDRDKYLQLMEAIPTEVSIWVDESVCTLEEARWFAINRAADGINLKISKNGGLLNCLEIAAIARNNGLACQLGAQVGETSLITAAGRILASLQGDFVYHEGSYGKYLLSYDIVEQSLDFGLGGKASLDEMLSQPGLGVSVNPKLVQQLRPLKTFVS